MSEKKELKQFVVGFAFDENIDRVLLILKTHPPHLANLWNGIGGNVEEGESLEEALSREFEEEADLTISSKNWKSISSIETEMGEVHFFATSTDISLASTPKDSDEQVRAHAIDRLKKKEKELAPFVLDMILDA